MPINQHKRVGNHVYGLAFLGDMTASTLIEITNPLVLKGRTVDRIVWLREPNEELRQAAFYCTAHSKFKDKIVFMYE